MTFFDWTIMFDPIGILYTLMFGLFVFCMVYPPMEFVSAGVTLENMFGKLLGNENIFFFEYHVRRTTLLRVVWSFCILLYYCTMFCLSDSVSWHSPNTHPPFTLWDFILWVGIACPMLVCVYTYHVWYSGGTWFGHPTCHSLRQLVDTMPDLPTAPSSTERWHALVSSINAECRRPDKFVASNGSLSSSWPGRRLIVTDSWILASHLTKFQIIRQSHDRLLAVVTSTSSVLDTGSFTEGGRPAGENLGTQTLVTIRFINIETGVCLLVFGLPASNLDALRMKLQCPLIRAEGVELEPTIVQRFLEAFSQVVSENGTVQPPSGLEIEHCIGCMISRANVTLVSRCDPVSHASLDAQMPDTPMTYVPPCGTCRCRPMWCLDCMARWFAARQTESHRPPSTWLAGRVPCPTCRTIFCVRDVVKLRSDLTHDS